MYMEILETGLICRKDALPRFLSGVYVYGRLKLQRHLYCTLVLPLFFEGSHLYLGYQKEHFNKVSCWKLTAPTIT